jgi:hypothetical protein
VGRKNRNKKRTVAAALEGFAPENSEAWKALNKQFGPLIHREAIAIAQILHETIRGVPELSRDEGRFFPLTIKWFHDNFSIIEPILPYVQLLDANGQVIDGNRCEFEMQMKRYEIRMAS